MFNFFPTQSKIDFGEHFINAIIYYVVLANYIKHKQQHAVHSVNMHINAVQI